MTFSLSPGSKRLVKEIFPDAHPVRSIYVAYEAKDEFEWQHGDMLIHVCPALVGASEAQIFEKVSAVRFVDPVKEELLIELPRKAS